MTEQEKCFEAAQKIVLAFMEKTAAVLDDIPCDKLSSRLEWLNGYSEIILRLSDAMRNVRF